MKKILFVINNLETGGVQKSLLNLLCEIHDKFDVTLLTFFGNNEFEKGLPDDIKIIKTRSSFRQLGMSAKHTRSNPLLYLERAGFVALTKIFGRSFVFKLMRLGRKKYRGYDVAVSFIHESSQKNLYGGCNEFVLDMVDAEKKIGWLHCDFGLCGANNPRSRSIYERFDTIVACSEGCKRSFLNCLPEFTEKTVSIRNCNDYDLIRSLAGDGAEYDKGYFNIVTVARLSEEKGIERALDAISECIRAGHKIKYHIVGSGDREVFLKQRVCALGLSDSVVFYGNKYNPYPYIKNADLFMLTSYHEAAPMVFDEAACLGIPVLATETTSTDEMIRDTGYGVVCANEQGDITEKLIELLSSCERIEHFKITLSGKNFNNEKIVEQIQQILC